MKRSSYVVCIWLVFLLLVTSRSVSAQTRQDAPRGPLRLSLAQCIAMALKNNAELSEARIKITSAESFLDEANAARLPQIELSGFLAPSPEARGDILNPRDKRARLDTGNAGSIGLLSRADFMVIQPLFTFFKITNLRKAARFGVAAQRAKVDQTREQVIRKVKELYYGLLLARELNNVLLQMEFIFQDALKDARTLLERGRGVQTGVTRLQIAQVVINGQKEEVKKSIELARWALAHQLGLPVQTDFDITSKSLRLEDVELQNLSAYIAMALFQRPELRRLRAGISARDLMLKAEKSDFWPRFFLAGGVRASDSTSFDRQTNPFANDPFNFFDGFLAFGMKWDLGIFKQKAEVKRARSEYRQLLAKQKFAQTGIPLQVRKSYLEVKQAKANVKNFRHGLKLARGLLALESSNFAFGLREARDLIDALVSYATSQKSFFESMYKHNLALASLSQAVGKELSPIHY